MNIAKKVSYCAMLTALAMIFSYVEALVPISFGVPGMKLGVANIVTVIGLYFLRPKEVLVILVMRILLTGFMFGNGMSIMYSLAGGILSFFVMLLLKKCRDFSMVGVSMIGGIFHNVGQIIMAVVVAENAAIFYYLPILAISGVITGFVIGIVGHKIYGVIKKEALHTAYQN